MYKEKYLKYKTKYIVLQNQLGGNSNIIQDGGFPRYIKGVTVQEMPNKTETQESLERGELLLNDYLRHDNNPPLTIIIIPNEIFYKTNNIQPDCLVNNYVYKLFNRSILYTTNTLIILQKSTNGEKSTENYWNQADRFVGLLIHYLQNKIFVIQWEKMSMMYHCKEINQIINSLKDERTNGSDSKLEYIKMFIDCLNESNRILSEYIHSDMNELIQRQISELKELRT